LVDLIRAQQLWGSSAPIQYAANLDIPAPRTKDTGLVTGLYKPCFSQLQQTTLERLPGITSPMAYYGAPGSIFAWHCEDQNLHSFSALVSGAPKVWWIIPPHQAPLFERAVGCLLDRSSGDYEAVGRIELQKKNMFITKENFVFSR
jgi:hypothetical protein